MIHLFQYVIDNFELTVTEDQENLMTVYVVSFNITKITGYNSYKSPQQRRRYEFN
jgi:hypothetical protein